MTAVGESMSIMNGDHGNSRVLNFKGSSITLPECEELCENIVNSDCLDSIRFSDCLLPEEIAKSIINALAKCKSIKVADFKGNKFRTDGAEQLCKLLMQTTTLKELYLEWNTLGSDPTSMEAIAGGIALNESVEILDLSRNQISQTGGKLLSGALQRNKTLKSLDLRWNNIGVAGGRELLSALQHNKTLVNIQLDGNNILDDTLNAISTAIQRNIDNHTLYQQHESMVQSLKDEIHRIENEKKLEVATLTNELEKAKELNESLVLTTNTKVEKLTSTLDNVSSEKESRETELKTAGEKIVSLEKNLSDLTKINSDIRSTHLEEIKVLKESVISERKIWEIETAAKDSLISTQNVQIEKNQVEINNFQNILKQKEENQIADDQKYQGEKERINREYEQQVKSLTDKIMKHLHDKEQLEGEITKLKTSLMNNKLMFDEELSNQRSKWKEEDAFRSKQYEEKIDLLVESKDELQSKINQLMIKETETNEKLAAHQNEIEKNQVEINNLQNLLKQKEENQITDEQKYQGEKEKIKREYEQQVKSLTDKIMTHLHEKEQLEGEITKLKTSIMNNKLMFDEELRNQRSKWKEEDAFKSKQYEEKIDLLVESKDELQSRINRFMIQERETSAKLAAHQKVIENYKQVILQNQDVNSNIRSTHLEEIKVLEQSVINERKKWEIENAAKESLISTLAKEKERQHSEIEKNQIKINNLQNLLKQKEENQIADEQKYQGEKEKTKREFEQQVSSLTNKIMKHLHDKEQLEEEITKLKTSLMNNKLMFDEELRDQRSKWKEEDAFRSKQYEEKIDLLVESKDELQSKINRFMVQETETNAKLAAHQNEIEKNQMEINNFHNLLKQKEENQIADEQKYQGEKERINREYEQQVKSLTDKIMKHLYDKEQFEEEITKLKTIIMNNELMFDEELRNQRSKWKEEDAFRSKQYEEKIDLLVESKDELQSKINKFMIQERETSTKLAAHQKVIENYRQVILEYQECAIFRDEQHQNEINKLQNEIDAEKIYSDMKCEMTQLRSEIAHKEKEILSLKEKVKNEKDEEHLQKYEKNNLNSILSQPCKNDPNLILSQPCKNDPNLILSQNRKKEYQGDGQNGSTIEQAKDTLNTDRIPIERLISKYEWNAPNVPAGIVTRLNVNVEK